MRAGQIIKKTMPFILLKALFTALPMVIFGGILLHLVLFVVDATNQIADVTTQIDINDWYFIDDYSLYSLQTNILAILYRFLWFIPIIILYPIISKIIGYIPRYLVRVGHISVLTHVIIKGEAPPRQLSYGFSQV